MESLSVINTDTIERLISRLDRLLSAQAPEPKADELDDLVSHERAAELLRISPYTLYGITCRKEIQFFKKGKRNFYSRRTLAEWIKAPKEKSHAA